MIFPRIFILSILAWTLSSCSGDQHVITEAPPNIILIMGDDMGYSDLGCYGGEIRTPHLDALAAGGLRFTQFYNAARCCPTRASLLTGLYPQQAGVGHMVDDRGTPAYAGDLSHRAVTIAEALKSAGYATYLSGKWHVTPYNPEGSDKTNWPRQRGFDRFFGMISGAGSFYDPRSLALDNDFVAPRDGFYSTTNFTDYAVERIEQHDTEDPFFMYVAYMAPHWPMHVPSEDAAKYKGYYDDGWDVMRASRWERMKEMGLASKAWEMTPRDPFVQPWSEDIPDKDWELANMEVYAAMTTVMDHGIGRIVQSLKDHDMYDNTLILFLQDNGACAEELDWVAPLPQDTPALGTDEVQTKMIPYKTRDGQQVKLMKDGWPGPSDGYTAYGLNWANASNTPFREYKHWVHEGGISTPLIAHWPAAIKDHGSFRSEPTHLIDIMATCLEVASVAYPESYSGHDIIPLEGKSLVPVFDNQSLEREAIYWEHEGNRAVRMGDWKLVSKASKKDSYRWDEEEQLGLEHWELFDMDKDRTEMHDLAASHPDVVSKMADMWLSWADRVGALPRPD